MKELLESLVNSGNCDYIEARYHKRVDNMLMAQKGRMDVANHDVTTGVGIRVLYKGAWGFAGTSDITKKGLKSALDAAIKSAKVLAPHKKSKPILLPKTDLYRGDFVGPGFSELQAMPLQEKLSRVLKTEHELATTAKNISKARCRYHEMFEEKTIITSDGANASLKLAQPEVMLAAFAEKSGEQTMSHNGAGVSGDWQCLFNHPRLEKGIENTAQVAVDLLSAKYPEGGLKTCILSPSIVGLLCHEAIGHTVEADFVKAGSVAQGKIGKQVASSLVNISDTGCENIAGYAVGNMPFDDEGVATTTVPIIQNGILTSYLHSRESAAEFCVKPTGNARAWLYDDEPLIRMRNTYFLPGNRDVQSMIAEIDDGYLVDGDGSGQADSNGEFMFGVGYVWRIKSGKKAELLREVTLSGLAFDVLKTVDAVSREFRWDLGTGYCGKGQPARVDAGGPYVRCKIHVGGR